MRWFGNFFDSSWSGHWKMAQASAETNCKGAVHPAVGTWPFNMSGLVFECPVCLDCLWKADGTWSHLITIGCDDLIQMARATGASLGRFFRWHVDNFDNASSTSTQSCLLNCRISTCCTAKAVINRILMKCTWNSNEMHTDVLNFKPCIKYILFGGVVLGLFTMPKPFGSWPKIQYRKRAQLRKEFNGGTRSTA